jgi:AraC-like DNA-binding protein
MTTSLSNLLTESLSVRIGGLGPREVHGPWAGGIRRLALSEPFESPVSAGNHRHPHPEICLLLDGRCRLSYDDQPTEVDAGALILIPGDLIHGESYHPKREPYRLAWWILPPASPLFQVTAYDPEEGFSVIHRIPLERLGSDMTTALERLGELAGSRQAPELLPLKEALLTTVVLLMRLVGRGVADLDQRMQVVDLATRFIETHLQEPLDLAEVGKAVHLSPNYLTTLFKRYTGNSLGQTIKRLRVRRACALLEDPRLKIKEVAAAVGIPDPFTFSKVFRAIEGVSPSEYREGLLIGESDRQS